MGSIFGSVYENNLVTATTIELPVAGTEATWALGRLSTWSKGCVFSQGVTTVSEGGIYLFAATFSFATSKNNSRIMASLFLNDRAVPDITFQLTTDVESHVATGSASGFAEMNKGNFVDFRFSSDKADDCVKLYHGVYRLLKLGESKGS